MQNKDTLSHLMKENNVSILCNNVSACLWVAISACQVGTGGVFVCLFYLLQYFCSTSRMATYSSGQ